MCTFESICRRRAIWKTPCADQWVCRFWWIYADNSAINDTASFVSTLSMYPNYPVDLNLSHSSDQHFSLLQILSWIQLYRYCIPLFTPWVISSFLPYAPYCSEWLPLNKIPLHPAGVPLHPSKWSNNFMFHLCMCVCVCVRSTPSPLISYGQKFDLVSNRCDTGFKFHT